jgi:SanA protein
MKSRKRLWLGRSVKLMVVGVVAVIGAIAYANLIAVWASRGRLFDDLAEVPATKVGLVFGTTDRAENPYFRYRIEAATRVWKSGKLKTLIVSGDNRRPDYNEPAKMKQALIERGVPEDRIVCDYAGLSTLDSVVRAKEIFDANSILVISQRFQNQRAIYLAQAHGIEAHGYNARDVAALPGLRTKLREVAARVKMWLDVNYYHTQPSHLGEKIRLPD